MSVKIISVIFGPKIRIKPAIFCINFRMLILQSFILKLSMYKAGESGAAAQCSFVALKRLIAYLHGVKMFDSVRN